MRSSPLAANPPKAPPAAAPPAGALHDLPDHERRALTMFLLAQIMEMTEPAGALKLVRTDGLMDRWQDVAQANPTVFAPPQVEPVAPPRRKVTQVKVDRELLQDVKDGSLLQSAKDNWGEHNAFNSLFLQVRDVDAKELKKAARVDVQYANLMRESAKYRGEVVHIQGNLRRLMRGDPTFLNRTDGIDEYYEAWIEQNGNEMYCVDFLNLPAGLEVGKSNNVRVSTDAYFFKRYRYSSGTLKNDKPVVHEVPLLIAKSIERVDPLGPSDADVSHWFIWSLMGVIVVVVVLAACLTIWFRRGDRLVQARVSAARHANFFVPDDVETAAEPPPVETPAKNSDPAPSNN